MNEPTLDLQTGIRSALIANSAVTGLVTPNSIFDGRARPEAFPCVIIGDGQSVLESQTYSRKHARLFLDLHIWTREDGLADVKEITGHLIKALNTAPAMTTHSLIDFTTTGVRFMRDPAEEYGHAVISVEALVEIEFA